MTTQNTQLAKTRVAIYLRVSTDEQAKEGYGLVYQEEKLRAFVKSQDYQLDEEYIYKDEGFSGSLQPMFDISKDCSNETQTHTNQIRLNMCLAKNYK